MQRKYLQHALKRAMRPDSCNCWNTFCQLNPGNIDADLAAAETAATVQTTQWTYSAHPTLSLVRTKTYPGRPIGVDYTYASDGSLATRDWERNARSHR